MTFNTLSKSLDIIDLLTRRSAEMNVAEISAELGMPKSTTYKYLAILKDRGFLEYDCVTKNYSLGYRFLELGSIVQSRSSLDKIALPFMKRLNLKTNETVILCILKFQKIYCLERIEVEGGLVFHMRRGSRLPLHCGAASKVLLAYSDESLEHLLEEGELKRYTPHTITDLQTLKEELKKIKKAGYAYADQEIDIGARAIAAPIFDAHDKVIGALDIVGPLQRMTDETIAKLIGEVVSYAKMISDEFKVKKSEK